MGNGYLFQPLPWLKSAEGGKCGDDGDGGEEETKTDSSCQCQVSLLFQTLYTNFLSFSHTHWKVGFYYCYSAGQGAELNGNLSWPQITQHLVPGWIRYTGRAVSIACWLSTTKICISFLVLSRQRLPFLNSLCQGNKPLSLFKKLITIVIITITKQFHAHYFHWWSQKAREVGLTVALNTEACRVRVTCQRPHSFWAIELVI